jgi:hypothetical protein
VKAFAGGEKEFSASYGHKQTSIAKRFWSDELLMEKALIHESKMSNRINRLHFDLAYVKVRK